MRFKEFSESLADVEKDPSVRLYRMLTSPFSSSDSASTPDVSDPAASVPANTSQVAIKGNEPALREPGFKDALNRTASNLGVDPNALIQIMKRESSLDPSRVNPNGGASGLIQFTGDTAGKLGTSLEAIRRMPAVEQLSLVEKYYKRLGVKPGTSVDDLYMYTFYPAAVGKRDNDVVLRKGQKGYSGNINLDKNRDGYITVADVKNFLHNRA